MDTIIRLATDLDAPRIAEIYAPYVVNSAVSFELEPPDAPEMARRTAEYMEKLPWIVCEHKGRVEGYVYASTHRARAAYCWSVEVSVYTGTDYRRSGMARALYTSLFECLRLQGLCNAYAGITLPNAASQVLHESMGFELIGVYHNAGYKCGAWHDVGWWQMALQHYPAEPRQPIPLPQAVVLPRWNEALQAGRSLLRLT